MGLVTAVVIAGSLGAYAMSQLDTNMPSSQDAKEIVSDIKDGISEADSGYGQVTKQEGAYSP